MMEQLALVGFEMTPACFDARLAEAGGDFEVLVAMLLTGDAAGDVREAMRKEAASEGSTELVAKPPPATAAKEAAFDDLRLAQPATKPPAATENSAVLVGTGATTIVPAEALSPPTPTDEASLDDTHLTQLATKPPSPPTAANEALLADTDSTGNFPTPEEEAAAAASPAESAKTSAVIPKGSMEGETLPKSLEHTGTSVAHTKTPAQRQAIMHKGAQGSCGADGAAIGTGLTAHSDIMTRWECTFIRARKC